jgi:hypothetical protein
MRSSRTHETIRNRGVNKKDKTPGVRPEVIVVAWIAAMAIVRIH